MASLDDIYDIIQKLEDSGIEYLLITVQKGKKQGKADVFFSLKDKASMKILATGLEAFNKEIDNIDRLDEDKDYE
ncbi:MAG: hypothetical protein EBR82_33900 [Caulobacteraceae bacterium]|nr:hypothetical protein [Caulobacteraceae bacterium]